MKFSVQSVFLASSLLVSAAVLAQVPAAAPSGSTGLCKDGSYTSNETKKGACAGHMGVKDWFAVAAAGMAPSKGITGSAPAPASASTVTTQPARTAPATAKAAPSTMPAAGGGPGQVWVNAATKVYHCAGTKYYGKTKQGEYMTEAAAKAGGNHADHGKACAS